jgi:hypothetical protein
MRGGGVVVRRQEFFELAAQSGIAVAALFQQLGALGGRERRSVVEKRSKFVPLFFHGAAGP